MPVIDERIVQLLFDNSDFEKNASQSMSTMGQLDKTIGGLGKSSSSIDQISASVNKVTGAFDKLGVVGTTIVTKLTSSLYDLGVKFAKSLTIDQYTAGFGKYESSLKSVRTMMTQTGDALSKIEPVMANLMNYSDQTSYNYAQMSDLMTKFVGVGASVELAEKMAEGVSNIGAYAGKGANEMMLAYNNFADAYANGFLAAGDYRSLANYAKVITPGFKQQLYESAEAFGYIAKAEDGYYYTTKKLAEITGDKAGKNVSIGDIRDTLQYQWARKDVLEDVLGNRFVWSEGDALDSIAYKAYQSAKEYRTFSDAVDTVKDVVSTDISESIKTIFGDADEAVKLWTAVGDKMVEIFAGPFDAIKEGLSEWKANSGRYYLLETLKYLWENVEKIASSIKSAFSDVFPTDVEDTMYRLTARLLHLGDALNLNEGSLQNIHNFFEGVFKLLKTSWNLVKRVGKAFFEPIGDFLGLKTDSFSSFIGDFGTRLGALADGIETSESLEKALGRVSDLIFGILSGIDIAVGKIGTFIDRIKNSKFGKTMSNVFTFLSNGFSVLGETLSGVASSIFDPSILDNLTKGAQFIPALLSLFTGLYLKNSIVDKAKSESKVKSALDTFNGFLGSLQTTISTVKGLFGGLSDFAPTLNAADRVVGSFKNFATSLLLMTISLSIIGSMANAGTLYDAMGVLIVMLSGVLAFLSIYKKIAQMSAIKSSLSTLPILILAGSMFTIAAALSMMSLFSTSKITAAALIMVGVITALSYIVKAMQTASGLTFKTNMMGLFQSSSMLKGALGIALLAGAIYVVSRALLPLALLPIGNVLVAAIVATAVIFALSLISKSMADLKKEGSFGRALTGFLGVLEIAILASMLLLVSAALLPLSLIPTDKLIFAAFVAVIIITALAGIASAMRDGLSGAGKRALTSFVGIIEIVILAAVLVAVANGIMPLAAMPVGRVTEAGIVAVAIVGALALIVSALSSSVNSVSWAGLGKMVIQILAISMLTGAIFGIAAALAIIGSINPSNLFKAGLVVAGIMFVLMYLSSSLGDRLSINLKSAGALVLAAIAVAVIAKAVSIIAEALSSMSQMSVGDALIAVVSIVATLIVIVKALQSMSKFIGEFKSRTADLVIAAIGILIIAAAIKMISEAMVNIGSLAANGTIWQSLIAVAAVIGILIGAIWLLTKVLTATSASAPAILSLAASLFVFGLACLTIAGAIFIVAASIALFVGVIAAIAAGIVYLGQTVSDVMPTILKGLEALATILFYGFYTIIYSTVMGISTAIIDATPYMAAALMSIGYLLISSLIVGIVGGLISGVALIVKYWDQLWTALVSGDSNLSSVMASFIKELGIESALGGAANDGGRAVSSELASGLGSGSAKLDGALDSLIGTINGKAGMFESAGGNLTESLFSGVKASITPEMISENLTGPLGSAISESLFGKNGAIPLPEGWSNKSLGEAISEFFDYLGLTTMAGEEDPNPNWEPGRAAPDGAKYAPAKINQAGEFKKIATEESSGYISGLEPMVDQSTVIAGNTIAGATGALMAGIPSFAEAGRLAATAYIGAYNAAMDIHSPSKKMEKAGHYTTAGLGNGLKKGIKPVTKMADDVATGAMDTINKALSDAGHSAKEELEQWWGSVVNVNTGSTKPAWGGGTQEEYQAWLGSDKYRQMSEPGYWDDDYWAHTSYYDPLTNMPATLTMSPEALAEAQKAAKNGGRRAKGHSAPTAFNDQGGSYSFVQNNYSPKSLSRIQIYRQTQNQFNNWKGGSSYTYDQAYSDR